jgi:hypothetical protein
MLLSRIEYVAPTELVIMNAAEAINISSLRDFGGCSIGSSNESLPLRLLERSAGRNHRPQACDTVILPAPRT